MTRPTASTINDDQVDALLDALDRLERLHSAHGRDGTCPQCMVPNCLTLQIISRQKAQMEEASCPS